MKPLLLTKLMTDHPITPPPELVHQWHKEACKDPYHGGTFFESKTLKHIATQAARWGADHELEACVNYIDNNMSGNKARAFRAIRRPKPPSLKEQALIELGDIYNRNKIDDVSYDTIRLALEQTND